jgi:hypothetical protein
MLSNY